VGLGGEGDRSVVCGIRRRLLRRSSRIHLVRVRLSKEGSEEEEKEKFSCVNGWFVPERVGCGGKGLRVRSDGVLGR